MPKFRNRKKAKLNVASYEEVLNKKQREFLMITRTMTFDSLKGVDLPIAATHVWSTGDSLHKLSQKYYGVYDYWWAIAIVNNKPTDAHYTYGDEVVIPGNPSILNNNLES